MFGQRAVVPLLLWSICVGTVSGGEIIIAPAAKSKAAAPAASPSANDKKRLDELTALRNKAQAYKSGGVQPMPSSGVPIIINMDASGEIEEGVLLPRNDDASAGSRLGNKGYYRGNFPATQDARPLGKEALPADMQNNANLLEKNRSKAHQYMLGKPAPSKVSPNDEMVVACDSTGSVSGRIGDDSMSGREIIVIRDGKQVKMRCK